MKKWTKASYLRRKLRVSKQNLRECLKNLKEPAYEWDYPLENP